LARLRLPFRNSVALPGLDIFYSASTHGCAMGYLLVDATAAKESVFNSTNAVAQGVS
jgi:hypothetical protein